MQRLHQKRFTLNQLVDLYYEHVGVANDMFHIDSHSDVRDIAQIQQKQGSKKLTSLALDLLIITPGRKREALLHLQL